MKIITFVKIVVLLLVAYVLSGCAVSNAVQIKNLKDEMKLMRQKVDSIQVKLNSLQLTNSQVVK